MSEETTTELVALQPINPVTVFGTEGGSESVIDAIRKQVEKLNLDVSTDKGRKEIASVAYKIARTKTALDDEGKKLKADMQKTVDLVDAERKKIRDAMDTLKEEVRKPLTDFENAEKLRVEERENRIASIQNLGTFPMEQPTVQDIQAHIDQIEGLAKFEWQEFIMRAEATAKEVSEKLERMKAARIKHDEDQAELERLRKEAEERDRKEREERIAREAAEKAKQEAEEKAAREKAEADAREAAERKTREEAEERARKSEEDRKADAERAEREKKEAEERAAQAERDRIAAEEKAKAEEDAKRQADKEHRGKINREILDALTKNGFTEDQSKTIITAIVKGEIPHTKINY